MEYFKEQYENKAFTLVHCWMEIKECQKWKTSYALYKKCFGHGNGNDSTVIDLEEGGPSTGDPSNGGRTPRPRGHKSSKLDLKCDASSTALHETLESLMDEKEEANAKRDEKRRMEKEATSAIFIDLQKRVLEVEESKARSIAIEAEAKLLAEESRILMADLTIMDPANRTWFEKKQEAIRSRDA